MSVTIGQIYESLDKYEKDNYYLKGVEPQKFGTGWEKLGDVEINAENYRNLAQGKDIQGNQLIDTRNGHRAGYNITFSPDKSFSVAAFASPEMKQALMDAHHQAVRDTLSYMEKELAQVRTSVNGEKTPIQTGNLVGFTIDHTCNRDGDVQIHTHAVIFNMSYNEQTGKWQALHSDAFKSNILEKIYENQLAYYLQERGFAIKWKQSESGKTQYASLAGVPDAAIDATSQRAAAIQAAVEQLKELYPNATQGELKQIAAYETRPDKREMTLEQIEKQFEQRLQQAGLTKQDIINSIEQAKQQAQQQRIETVKMNEYEIAKQAYTVIAEQKAVFSKQDLIKAATDISKGDAKLQDIEKAIDTFLKDKDLINLADEVRVKDGSRTYADTLYTTKENLIAEKSVFKIAEQGKDKLNAIYTKEQATKEIQAYEQKTGFKMTDSQRQAIETALTTRDLVSIYQGYAGTGKTTVLESLKELAGKQGYKVIGMSETNVAVNQMKESKIDAYTVTKFLHSSDLKNAVNDKTILVVDECSFMGARNMEQVLKIAQQNNARVLLFGDKAQLPPIQAGYSFKDLQEKNIVTVVEMKDVIRQTNQELKQAVEHIIKQDIDKAFEKLNVVELQQKDELYNAAAEQYLKDNGYKKSIISTYQNADKDKLNELIREKLQAENKISSQNHTFTVYAPLNLQGTEKLNIQNYKVGDKLIVQKAGAGVKVGAELTVKSIDFKNHTLTAERMTKQGLKEYTIDIRRQGDHFNAYRPERKDFSIGDKIIFNANSKENGIVNSQVAYIKDIKDNKIVASLNKPDGKQTVTFDATQFKYFDYGYASTTYKAQGKTSQNVIYFAPVSEKGFSRSYQDFYVGITRAKENATIYTNNAEKLKEQVKQFAEKETVISTEQKLNKNFDSIYQELADKQTPLNESKAKSFHEINLAKHITQNDLKNTHKKIQILPGISYQKDKGLIVSNTKAKDTLKSILTGKHDTFVKESKVILGKEKGAKVKTEYQITKDFLGTKHVKGTTVTVDKNKSFVTITKWKGTIDELKLFGNQKLSAMRNVKSESISINVKGLNKDLEKLKNQTQDKDKIKHIEKAQKHLDKLTKKADAKHYEKAKNELSKAGIDLDRIRTESTSKTQSTEMYKTETKSITPSKTISNEKAAANMREISSSKSDTSSMSKTDTQFISKTESSRTQSIEQSRGR